MAAVYTWSFLKLVPHPPKKTLNAENTPQFLPWGTSLILNDYLLIVGMELSMCQECCWKSEDRQLPGVSSPSATRSSRSSRSNSLQPGGGSLTTEPPHRHPVVQQWDSSSCFQLASHLLGLLSTKLTTLSRHDLGASNSSEWFSVFRVGSLTHHNSDHWPRDSGPTSLG